MMTKEEMSQAVSNPIWNYFSGYTYNSKLLLDYGLMSKEVYPSFIKALAFQSHTPKVPQHFNLPLDALYSYRYNGTLLDADTHEPFIHDCESAFSLMIAFYAPLKLRRLELGLSTYALPVPLTDEKYQQIHHGFLQHFAIPKANSFDCVNGLDFVFNIISDLCRQTTQKGICEMKREQALCRVAELTQDFKEILPNVADTALLESQPKMMETVFSEPEKTRKALMHFYFMTNPAFNLKNKPLSCEQLLQRSKQMLDLVDKSIIYEPFVSEKVKTPFFNDVLILKDRLEKQTHQIAKHSILQILKQRGQNEKN